MARSDYSRYDDEPRRSQGGLSLSTGRFDGRSTGTARSSSSSDNRPRSTRHNPLRDEYPSSRDRRREPESGRRHSGGERSARGEQAPRQSSARRQSQRPGAFAQRRSLWPRQPRPSRWRRIRPPDAHPRPGRRLQPRTGGDGAHRHRAGRHLRHGAFPHRSFRIGRRQRRQQARRCRQRQRRGQQRFLLRAERRHPGKPRPPRRAGAGPAARLHADPRRPHQPRRSEGPLRLRPRQRDQRRRRAGRRARALRPFPRELEQRALLLRQQ